MRNATISRGLKACDYHLGLWIIILILSTNAFPLFTLHVKQHQQRRNRNEEQLLRGVIVPTQHRDSGDGATMHSPLQDMTTIQEESNFWFAVRKRNSHPEIAGVPYFQNLDAVGALPDSCYTRFGEPRYEPKPNCIISMDLRNIFVDNDDDGVLSFIHQSIDSGLSTFQGGSPHSHRVLRQHTPSTILNQINWITSIKVPTLIIGSPRDILLRPLYEMGGQCIDTLQLQTNPQSPYFLDLLDVAMDLQREGLVRSIVGNNMLPKLMRQVHECGFRTETNQLSMNLLDPTRNYNAELVTACDDTNSLLVIDNPLAGGFLTGRYHDLSRERRGEPYKFELTPSERRNLVTLHEWSQRKAKIQSTNQSRKKNKNPQFMSPWGSFQSEMMDVLHHIALKHCVPIEAVILRWTLQQEKVSQVVVPCDVGTTRNEMTGTPYEQFQRLRRVFSFHLDQDDVEELWKTSGCEPPKPPFNLVSP